MLMFLYFRLTVYDLLSEGGYLVDLTLSTHLDADVSVPCYQSVDVFKAYKRPKPLCEWNSHFPIKGRHFFSAKISMVTVRSSKFHLIFNVLP